MSQIQRSRSAPHVAPLQPFLVPDHPRPHEHPPTTPRIRRHHTSLALTDLATPSSSRSGYQTPRADRTEDPFSLGGFFPSQLPVPVRTDSESDWNWLRSDQPDLEPSDGTRSVYDDPEDEDEDEDVVVPCRPMFDNTEDVKTGETILKEDKLGVLSMSAIFSSARVDSHSTVFAPYDRLLSPYCEDNPLDHDAVYQSWSALRAAHSVSTAPPRVLSTAVGCSGPLFSPVEDAAASEYAENGSWQSVLSRGVGAVLDLLSV